MNVCIPEYFFKFNQLLGSRQKFFTTVEKSGWGTFFEKCLYVDRSNADPKFDPISRQYDANADVVTITCEVKVLSHE